MPELTRVPTFTFRQGSAIKGDADYETPIEVRYYNNCIELSQEGEYDIDESIKIHPKYFEKLFKEIRKHLPEAKHWLEKDNPPKP